MTARRSTRRGSRTVAAAWAVPAPVVMAPRSVSRPEAVTAPSEVAASDGTVTSAEAVAGLEAVAEPSDEPTAASSEEPPGGGGAPASAMRARGHSFRANALALAAGQLTTWTASFLTFTLLPRHLGPAAFGIFAIGLSFLQLSVVFGRAGFNTLLTREIARDPEQAGEWLATLFWLGVGLGVLAALAADLLAILLGYDRETLGVIWIMSTSLPLGIVSSLGMATAQGIEQMSWHARIDVAAKTLLLAAMVAVILAGGGVMDAAVAYVIAAAITAGFATVTMVRIFPVSVRLGLPVLGEARRLLGISVPFMLVEAASAAYVASDVLLLSRLADSAAAGVYQTPYRVASMVLAAPLIVATVVFPRMASRSSGGDFAALHFASLRTSLAVAIPVAVLMLGAGGDALVILLGPGFEQSRLVMSLLAIAIVPMSANIVLSRAGLASGRERWWSRLVTVMLVVKVLLALVLIPLAEARFDNAAAGAAMALVLTEWATVIYALDRMKLLGREQQAVLWRMGAAGVLAGAAAAAVPLWERHVGAGLIAGALAYPAFALLLRAHTIDELRETFWRVFSGSRPADATARSATSSATGSDLAGS
jgi:O-antigen/teichoic acid export membrane protein